jgi:hypothetical protein
MVHNWVNHLENLNNVNYKVWKPKEIGEKNMSEKNIEYIYRIYLR